MWSTSITKEVISAIATTTERLLMRQSFLIIVIDQLHHPTYRLKILRLRQYHVDPPSLCPTFAQSDAIHPLDILALAFLGTTHAVEGFNSLPNPLGETPALSDDAFCCLYRQCKLDEDPIRCQGEDHDGLFTFFEEADTP